MAEWIAGGEPPMDLWGMDIRRFGAHFGSPSYTVARANEVYETYYSIAYPGTERQAGRPLRVSPVYEWHRAHGAAFGEKAGWERVNYYEANAPAGDPASRPKGWAGRLWSPATGAEHRAAREHAALFDESSFAKIEVRGPDAADFLERMCANEVAGPVGGIRYTQMLNRRGGIESDLTVSRCAPDRFWLVTGTAFGTHDLEWLRTHLPARGVELSRHHLGLCLLRVVGSAGEGNTPGLLARGPGQRGLSLSHPTVDPGRERAGRSAPRQLRR